MGKFIRNMGGDMPLSKSIEVIERCVLGVKPAELLKVPSTSDKRIP